MVNPVFTHDVPYRYVAKVESDDRGTLTVTTTQAPSKSAPSDLPAPSSTTSSALRTGLWLRSTQDVRSGEI
ncbi:hypothetical protein [Streptomyces sp. NPDC056544]|uniref:hypothetical protein n=1 Tax=unclassified Streptomyces TaxID=2593676 RepID=UPI0036A01ADF